MTSSVWHALEALRGWKTDPFCFGFFPQNDSSKPMCYRSEDALVKYYDIQREAQRADYTIHNGGVWRDSLQWVLR